MSAQSKRTRKSPDYKSLLAVIALILPILLAASCNTVEERIDEVGGLTAQQIIENPSAYVGKTVTVSGDVEEIHSPKAFNMDSGTSLGELLVVGREPFPQVTGMETDNAYLINDIATVTGVVRLFKKEDIDREIGWDLDSQLATGFEGKPVLVAQSVSFRRDANRAATTAPANTADGKTMTNAGETMTNTNAGETMTNDKPDQTANADEITDYAMLTGAADKQTLVGKRVNLKNLKVLSVPGDRTFYVGDNEGQKIFVVLDEVKTPNTAIEGRYDITAGQTVSLNGIIEKMPSVAEAKQRFGRLMDEKELNKLKDQPILLHVSAVDVKK